MKSSREALSFEILLEGIKKNFKKCNFYCTLGNCGKIAIKCTIDMSETRRPIFNNCNYTYETIECTPKNF